MAVKATHHYSEFRNFSYSNLAVAIAFLWGFCEATFFFVVPDVFFMLTTLFVPRRGFIHVIVTTLGSFAGGSLMYVLAYFHPREMSRFLTDIPLISQKMIALVNDGLIKDSLHSMFLAPVRGIPYKIYAVQSAVLKIDYFQFLIISIPARLERMLVLTAAVSLVVFCFGNNIKKNTKIWILGYGVLWVVFYVVYALRMKIAYY